MVGWLAWGRAKAPQQHRHLPQPGCPHLCMGTERCDGGAAKNTQATAALTGVHPPLVAEAHKRRLARAHKRIVHREAVNALHPVRLHVGKHAWREAVGRSGGGKGKAAGGTAAHW